MSKRKIEDHSAVFMTWLDRAYRDGSKGDDPKFTKWNMEVAYFAGIEAERLTPTTRGREPASGGVAMTPTLPKSDLARVAFIIAIGFISWLAIGMPVPEYRRLLADGDIFTLNRTEWTCASERSIPRFSSTAILVTKKCDVWVRREK